MVKTKRSAPVLYGAKTLENIGKADYSGVAAAMSSTGYRQIRQKPAGGKQ